MTVGTWTSFVSDNDSISEAKLGDRILLELELTLGVAGSFTATKNRITQLLINKTQLLIAK